jgi:hypothetical protein
VVRLQRKFSLTSLLDLIKFVSGPDEKKKKKNFDTKNEEYTEHSQLRVFKKPRRAYAFGSFPEKNKADTKKSRQGILSSEYLKSLAELTLLVLFWKRTKLIERRLKGVALEVRKFSAIRQLVVDLLIYKVR